MTVVDEKATRLRRKMSPIAIVIIVSSVLVLAGFLAWRQWYETYHFAVVDPGKLYRDGNRGPREFATMLRKAKPKTVVCLVDDDELVDPAKPEFAAEMDALKRQGITVERVAVRLGGWPTNEDVRRFLDVATNATKQPVLVHCAQGVRRTGMMVAAYQESVLGYDRDR